MLAKGDIAIATSRKPEALKFDGASDKNFLAVGMDVTDQESVAAAFDKAVEKFHKIDVVVKEGEHSVISLYTY